MICTVIAIPPLIQDGQNESCHPEPGKITVESTHAPLGISLTEQLILQRLAEQPLTVGEIFRDLMQSHEPLPWFGDIMFLFITESMKRTDQPVFTGVFEGQSKHWPHERLTITPLGRAVLAGEVDWLSLHPPERWIGGVRITTASPGWRWDEQRATTVLR